MTSHWKWSIGGVCAAALLAASCQKSENAGGASASPSPAMASETSAQAATGGAARVGDAAQVPFGFLDTPREAAAVKAGSWAFGWALDDSGIAQITVASERGISSPVFLNQPFPGVAQSHPNFPNADKAGFGFAVPPLPPGPHTLVVTLIAKDGGRTEIRRQVLVQ